MVSDRRKFILNMARGAGITALGGFVWSAYVDEVTASQLLLRPPGAIKEEDFLKKSSQMLELFVKQIENMPNLK